MKVVIIGGQIAGSTFAINYKKSNPNDEVVLINKNIHLSYITSALPYFLQNDVDEENLMLYTEEDFINLGITLYLKSEVISVSPEENNLKIIKGDSGNINVISYDKLIIASGCNSVKLPEFENKGNNIFILKNILNAKRMKKYIKDNKPKKALIVGGGLSSLSTLNALKNLGIDIDIIEKEDHLINQFEKEISSEVLKYLKENKVNVYLNTKIKSVKETERNKLEVEFGNESKIYDMVVVCSGIIPNTTFMKNTELNMTKIGYIFVNENFETNLKDIYAIGDIAIVKTKGLEEYILPKLSGSAKNQAEILNAKLSKHNIQYLGTTLPIIQKVLDIEIGKIGINSLQAKENNISTLEINISSRIYPKYINDDTKIYLKALFTNDLKFLGIEMIGKNLLPLLNYFSVAIKKEFTASDFVFQELVFDPETYVLNSLISEIGKLAIEKKDKN